MSAGELYYAESDAIKAAKHFDQFAGQPLGELGGYYHDQASVYRKVRREKEGRKS
jgi:membrane-bound lytic murein transglycosylase